MREGQFNEKTISSWPEVNQTLPDEPLLQQVSAEPSRFQVKNFTITPPDQSLTYSVDTLTMWVVKTWLRGLTSGLTYTVTPNSVSLATSEDKGQFFFTAQKIVENGTSRYSGPEPVFARMAEIFTAQIRNMASLEYAVAGIAQTAKTFVETRWWFCVLPVALVGLTFTFLLLTIFISVRNDIPIWKSSVLAILAHGLDETTSSAIAANKLDATEDCANRSEMVIGTKGSNWRLKGSL